MRVPLSVVPLWTAELYPILGYRPRRMYKPFSNRITRCAPETQGLRRTLPGFSPPAQAGAAGCRVNAAASCAATGPAAVVRVEVRVGRAACGLRRAAISGQDLQEAAFVLPGCLGSERGSSCLIGTPQPPRTRALSSPPDCCTSQRIADPTPPAHHPGEIWKSHCT
jgi:hypothetical protein